MNDKGITSDKDLRKLVKQAIRLGCTIERGARHCRVVTPTGERVLIAGSPSDRRGVLNFRADLARFGIIV